MTEKRDQEDKEKELRGFEQAVNRWTDAVMRAYQERRPQYAHSMAGTITASGSQLVQDYHIPESNFNLFALKTAEQIEERDTAPVVKEIAKATAQELRKQEEEERKRTRLQRFGKWIVENSASAIVGALVGIPLGLIIGVFFKIC